MNQTQYFANQPAASSGELDTLTIESRGLQLTMSVAGQIFSRGKLDLGTQQLLAKAPQLPASGTFLDLGCGWGPLAVTMASESPQATVWAIDSNERAVDLTRRNATNNHVHVEALIADEAVQRAQEDGVRFDVIWSNPPIRVGKEALHRLLVQWLSLLTDSGVAYLVVSKNLGADSLAAWLQTQGFAADKLASKKGYRILHVRHAQG